MARYGRKGAKAMLLKYGPEYMRKLAKKRWEKHPEQRSEKYKQSLKKSKKTVS